MIVSAIFAAAENHVIGENNKLPWRLKADLQHFKRLTLDKPIIMGRNTWDSLNRNPLPRRRHIVITSKDISTDKIDCVASLSEALGMCKDAEEVFLIGGAQLFRAAFEEGIIDKIYLTIVHAEPEGDVFFEIPNREEWRVISVDARQADDDNEFAFTFVELEKHATH